MYHLPVSKTSKCDKCGIRCVECKSKDKEGNYKRPPCSDTRGFQERIFYGDNTDEKLAAWMFDRERAGFMCIAHNAGGYDSYILLNYLLTNGRQQQEARQHHISGFSHYIYGNKKSLNIRVIDSLKFLQMKLAKLPKVFGLHETKGWFPHHFNKKENWNYIWPYPDKKYFGVDLTNEQETLTFTEWYNEKFPIMCNLIFNKKLNTIVEQM